MVAKTKEQLKAERDKRAAELKEKGLGAAQGQETPEQKFAREEQEATDRARENEAKAKEEKDEAEKKRKESLTLKQSEYDRNEAQAQRDYLRDKVRIMGIICPVCSKYKPSAGCLTYKSNRASCRWITALSFMPAYRDGKLEVDSNPRDPNAKE